MKCLASTQLAQAVTEMSDEVSLHLSSCAVCRCEFDAMVQVAQAVHSVVAPSLSAPRRDLMLRAVFAEIDGESAPAELAAAPQLTRRWTAWLRFVRPASWRVPAFAALALLLVGGVWWLQQRGRHDAVSSSELAVRPAPVPALVPVPVPVPVPALVPVPVPVPRAGSNSPNNVPSEGATAVNMPSAVGRGNPGEQLPKSPSLKAVDQRAPTFAPSQHANRSPVVEQESLPLSGVPSPAPEAAPEPSPAPAPSAPTFADGWTQFTRGNYGEAIAVFDAVREPATREDAMYWAAVAAARANLSSQASSRLNAFLAQFPDSPRRASAQALLQKLVTTSAP